MAEFVRVAARAEVQPGRCQKVRAGKRLIALFNLDGQLYAIDDTCSHAEASLSEGEVSDGKVACPLHGALFDIKTGAALTMPAWEPVATYVVEVRGDEIWIDPTPVYR